MKNVGKEKYGTVRVYVSVVLVSLVMLTAGAAMADPVLTARFANPRLDCEAGLYTLDVELQSSAPLQQLFGMNVRFFYNGNALDFVDFVAYEEGYGPFNPSPPQVRPGNAASGAALFGFEGAAVYVNGAVKLIDNDAPPVYISVTEWTKLFSVRFAVLDPEALNGASFCPSVLWDLDHVSGKGGMLQGSNGLVMTVVADPPMESATVARDVVQFNGRYNEDLAGPKILPDFLSCVSAECQTETPATVEESDVLLASNDTTAVVAEIPEEDAVDGDALVPDTTEDAPVDVLGSDVSEEDARDETVSDVVPPEDEAAEAERTEDANTESLENESGAEEESTDTELTDDTVIPAAGCAGCGSIAGKQMRDVLADWLLIGMSMLVLFTTAAIKK